MTARFSIGTSVLGLLLLGGIPSHATEVLRQEAKNLYRAVPDVPLTLLGRDAERLASLWERKPLVLALFYSHCTRTCGLFLRNLDAAVTETGGADAYDVVALSFDPEDTLEDVAKMARGLGLADKRGWFFGVSDPASMARLMDAVGFWRERDANDPTQFDHPSMVVGIRDGRIVQVLLGTAVAPSRMRDLIYEIRGVFVPYAAMPDGEIRFRCFQVDPETGAVTFDWGMLLLVAPGLTASLIGVLLFSALGRQRRRSAGIARV
ncbi:MAG: SCO family protein [Deltaproteobacteria bacterium]|nr:SCO family protein [Deltaproteobacteria bacterium]